MKLLEGIPSILYKYRDWSNIYHKKIITENQIFLSSQNGFNDPFDATIPFRYDEKELTPENIFLKLYETGKELMPNLTEEELIEECYRQQNSGIFENGSILTNFSDGYTSRTEDIFFISGLLFLMNLSNHPGMICPA